MASRGDTISKAIELKSDEDVVRRLRERMPDALKQLEDMACGKLERNAQSQLKAIELMLRFSQPLPKQVVEHQGSVGISVINPYAEDAEAIEGVVVETPALPAVGSDIRPDTQPAVAAAPVRRRKKAPAEPV